MEKILIAIASCERDSNNGYNQAVRDTWLKNKNVEYKFFRGVGNPTEKVDEVLLPCKDDYLSLPEKTMEILKWSISNEYNYIFKFGQIDLEVLPSDIIIHAAFRERKYPLPPLAQA